MTKGERRCCPKKKYVPSECVWINSAVFAQLFARCAQCALLHPGSSWSCHRWPHITMVSGSVCFCCLLSLRAPPKEDWVCACRPLPTPCYSLRSFLMTFCLPGRHQKMINFDCCFGFQQQIRNEPSKMPSKILMRMNVQKLCNKQEPIYLPRLPSQSLRVQWPFNCCSTLPCLNSAGSSCLVETNWIKQEFQSPKAKARHPWNDPNSEKLRQRNVTHQGSHQRGRWLSLIQINFGCPEIAESQGAALDHPILGLVSLPHRKKKHAKGDGRDQHAQHCVKHCTPQLLPTESAVESSAQPGCAWRVPSKVMQTKQLDTAVFSLWDAHKLFPWPEIIKCSCCSYHWLGIQSIQSISRLPPVGRCPPHFEQACLSQDQGEKCCSN